MTWFNRFSNLFRRQTVDDEVAEELRFHLDARIRDNLNAGMTAEAAEQDARKRFGNSTLAKERAHEMNIVVPLETIGRDLRFALRTLRKSPGFTAVALLTLALGVGANTTVFSIINGLLLRPLAVPHSDRLAVLAISRDGPTAVYSFPEPLLRGLETRHEAFATVFGFCASRLQVRGPQGNENFDGDYVSGGFFPALETAPLLGRTLTPADDRKGGDPAGFAVVIGEHFWESWFNRAPDVVGRKLTINNAVFTVVGVMPKRFIGADPLARPALYLPLATEQILNGARNMTDAGVDGWWIRVMGRLEPGVTLEQADAAVAAATSSVLHENARDEGWVSRQQRRHFHFRAESGSTGFTYVRLNFRKPLTAVFAMCGGVLLLACLNLTSLLMARGAARERELATRLAMGATRRRLTQQLLTESLLIGVIGTTIGLAVAPLVSQALSTMLLSGARGGHLDTSLDIRVFAFAALVAILATLVIGLVPALRATSSELNEQIKSGQHTIQAHERSRWLPRVLMSVEVALALVLVVGAGLLASSLVRLYRSGEGFDPRGVQNVAFSMDNSGMDHDALMNFYRDMKDRLRSVPGVRQVSFAQIVPFTGFTWDEDFAVATGPAHDVDLNAVAPDYFRAMRIPMLEGRDFRWNDTKDAGLKIILNETAAKLLFPHEDPLGRIVKKSEGPIPPHIPYEVIGVVADAKYGNLRRPAPAIGYTAMMQDDEHTPSYYAVVRTDGDAGSVASAARTLARQMAPGIPAPTMTSMMTTVDDSLSAERMMALLSVFFAACALLVTAIGLYGTLAYATARRTSEIGIRMALGARRAQVVALVCGQNARVAIAGTMAGLLAAVLASKALASFLYGTTPRDPWVLMGSVLALAFIASAASILPAVRAARIDPMRALRNE